MNRYTFDAVEHVHTLDGRPLMGTSTITKIIAKPLTWWAAGMALTALGWKNEKLSTKEQRALAAAEAQLLIGKMGPDEYAGFLQACYRAHDKRKTDAAKTGTDMHAELEAYVKQCISAHGGKPLMTNSEHPAVQQFAAWALDNVEQFLYSEANCYSESLWVGGISDAGAKLKDGHTAIIDFKSSKDAYYDQFIQAGGYAQQIGENGLFDADGNKTGEPIEIDALIVFPFGGGKPTAVYAIEDYQRAFVSAALLHKLQGTFDDIKITQ